MRSHILQCLSLTLLLVLPFMSSGESTAYYHQVKVKEGEGVLALLKRYELHVHPCNVEQFYELNQLTKKDFLLAGVKYKIPVLIYKYNSKSIRSTIGIDDWEKAVRIKEYNRIIKSKRLRKSTYTESLILWVPHHELFCNPGLKSEVEDESLEIEVSNSASKKVFVPLYGEKYSETEIVDESLAKKVFYIVSGHGGPDPGAICTSCPRTLCEDEYAYDVSLRLARNLKQHGAIVHMIIQDSNDGIRDEQILECDKDETCLEDGKIPLNQLHRLKQRTDAINKLYSHYRKKGNYEQIALMIHVDSRSEHKRQDVFFYHYKHSKSGKRIAENLLNTFDTKYKKHQKNRGYKGYIKDRGLYVLRNTAPPAVYVELANIRNKADHKRLLLNSNRQALANWLFMGLLKSVDLGDHKVTAP